MKRSKRILAIFISIMTIVSQILPGFQVQAFSDSIRLATFNIAANKKPDIVKMNELLKKNPAYP